MEKVEVKQQNETESGWNFLVSVGERDSTLEYSVNLDKDYWEELTKSKVKPDELVKSSFDFLLTRESKESILREFNIQVINKYFPEYETEIKKMV